MNRERIQYGKKGRFTRSGQLGKTTPPAPSLNMYQSIQTLPLNRFVDCYVDNNLYALVISGHPDPVVLRAVWDKIFQEYTEKGSSSEYTLYRNVLREIGIMQTTYDQIHTLVPFLKDIYCKYLCDELNDLIQMKCTFNPEDPATYRAELDKCLRRTSGLKMRIDLKRIQFDGLLKKFEGKNKGADKKKGRDYFMSILISLSDHAKYQIQDTITVFEYLERIERANDYYDKLSKAVKK